MFKKNMRNITTSFILLQLRNIPLNVLLKFIWFNRFL